MSEIEQLLMRGFPVPTAGTYILLEDAVAALRAYAQAQDAPEAGGAIHEAATWLSSGEGLTEPRNVTESFEEEQEEAEEEETQVDRIELYPEETPRGVRWYARSVDATGAILHTTAGSYDYEYVHKDANERWPGMTIYQLNRWGDDSVFMEQQEKMASPTSGPLRERISPKRMFGT